MEELSTNTPTKVGQEDAANREGPRSAMEKQVKEAGCIPETIGEAYREARFGYGVLGHT